MEGTNRLNRKSLDTVVFFAAMALSLFAYASATISETHYSQRLWQDPRAILSEAEQIEKSGAPWFSKNISLLEVKCRAYEILGEYS